MNVTNATVEINGFVGTSDDKGNVSVFIPLESQNKVYKIVTPMELYNDVIFMPCGENDVILTK